MNKNLQRIVVIIAFILTSIPGIFAQQSVAREWNESLLNAIRKDLARPPVQARNLFHTSVAMYDAWAIYDGKAKTYLLGKTVEGFTCPFDTIPVPTNIKAAQEEALSFAVYRVLAQRFKTSPNAGQTLNSFKNLMIMMGYDFNDTTTNYQNGSPASLGNYIGKCVLEYGFQDGSNELNNYANQYYQTVNPPLVVKLPGNPDIVDPNRWQRLTIDGALDQNGNPVPSTQGPLSPEWGNVKPFALDTADLTIHTKNGHNYLVYHDPGPFPMIDTINGGPDTDEYKWNFSIVNAWTSFHDPTDGVMQDISPASIGNVQTYPETVAEYHQFYDYDNGGDTGTGHAINPKTGLPYEQQVVPRGDFVRVLTQFWADGPTSETPPGHWYTILNYVGDQPGFERKFNGKGPSLDPLEWDVKSYLTLGGGMHDAAITAWGMKGWYDGVRPISALRYMADQGQSSDPNLPSYNINGMPLDSGFVELVDSTDALAGANYENVGKIKFYTWRGPAYINNPNTDFAGVGWILAENWWPYQRKTFVTPPFPGYISGHSTFSRTGADLMTYLTGDPFFPGGMAEFEVKANSGFLVIEKGPSVDVKLQWATYRDASDQCSLSRIWGGIHPPMDDIPGRKIGEEIANDAFETARKYFYTDNDNDGFFSNEDCDDNNPTVHPGAAEICDGIDNNCENGIDEMPVFVYYRDSDNDGYGNNKMSFDTCSAIIPSGYVTDNTDCDDTNSAIHPNATEICDELDNDCNGEIDDLVTYTYYRDSDGDGYGNNANSKDTCSLVPPSGYVTNNTDCNDVNAMINPAALEICDGLDNNCNGLTDDMPTFTYFRDSDNDGFGDLNSTLDTCLIIAPAGYVTNNADCNDNSAAINPTAIEICDGVDNNCDGNIDDLPTFTYYLDSDSDGYGNDTSKIVSCLTNAPIGYVSNNNDCNDSNSNINPIANEVCDGIDNDCNGQIDDVTLFTYYADKDADTYGDIAFKLDTCSSAAPLGYVSNNQDCDDTDASVHPGASELCDGKDNDCNGSTDENLQIYTYYRDNDGDGFGDETVILDTCNSTSPVGFVTDHTDCDDNDASSYPTAIEICDGKDNNCNGEKDEGLQLHSYYVDNDGDAFGNPDLKLEICWDTPPVGFVSNSEDCDDSDSNIYPGATEVCDSKDNDCNGLTDEGLLLYTFYADSDGDGYGDTLKPFLTCYSIAPSGFIDNDLDCDDVNPFINPAQPEITNGLDDDCDGQIDETVATTDLSNDIKLYPNPFHEIIRFSYEKGRILQYKVVNANGLLMRKGEVNFENQQEELDLSNLLPGLYILNLYDADANKQMFSKVVKM